MKKISLILISSLLFATSAYAKIDDWVSLDNLTVIKLNKIQVSKFNIDLHYPGKNISGSCSIVIRPARGDVNDEFKKLAERFIFTHLGARVEPDTSNHTALVFPLYVGTYVDRITIETKDGKSIADNISSAAIGNVGVIAGVCA